MSARELVVAERSVQLMKSEADRCGHKNAAQRLCCYCAAKQLARELRYQDVERLCAENADLRERIRLARAALRHPGSRYIADVDDALNLRKPLRKVRR